MEVKPTLAEAVEAQRQLDIAAKRQVGRPFQSTATGPELTYIVDRLRMLEVAAVGGNLVTPQGVVYHTPEEGKVVLAAFVAKRDAVETTTYSEKVLRQVDIVAAHAALAELTIESADATTQIASATA